MCFCTLCTFVQINALKISFSVFTFKLEDTVNSFIFIFFFYSGEVIKFSYNTTAVFRLQFIIKQAMLCIRYFVFKIISFQHWNKILEGFVNSCSYNYPKFRTDWSDCGTKSGKWRNILWKSSYFPRLNFQSLVPN